MKTVILSILCLCLLPIQACSQEYQLMKHKNKQGGIPLHFEQEISPGLKQLIQDDIELSLQHIKNISIKRKTQKYKTLEGTVVKERRYYDIEGTNIYPDKLDDLFYKIKKKKGKDYVFVNKNIIQAYKKIYRRLDYYQGLHKEIKEFIAFLNNIENIDEKDIPDMEDVVYMVGFNKSEVDDLFDKKKSNEKKGEFKTIYKDMYFYTPSIVSIVDSKDIEKTLEGKLCVETVIRSDGEITQGIPLVKDKGEWKLLLILPGV